eukprot:TRINITY_DN20003_c0_g1_i3.p2 TRINITY_DN20003_c0_g1~~TRINITY_DN20003_c0_g1_i3.p2  ORF type:complete len:124 (-),score=1.59 TRINITY_DN20003_c0_g1_i3:57-428(-)
MSRSFLREYYYENVLFWQNVIGGVMECLIEYSIGRLGFVYVIVASVLIVGEAVVFFEVVLPELINPNDHPLLHEIASLWLLFNVLFNYIMCIITKPYTSLDIAPETLEQVYPQHSRYCDKCFG